MKSMEEKFRHIKGWGIDADPENEPTYPIKKYTGADHKRLHYKKPVQQDVDMEILHSNERPGITSVFGTSVAPSGISGIIRRLAFRKSESSYAHWLPLIFADRINVFEGILADLAHGHVPNFFAERGWKAEWKYNRKTALRKIAVSTLITTAVIGMIAGKSLMPKPKKPWYTRVLTTIF